MKAAVEVRKVSHADAIAAAAALPEALGLVSEQRGEPDMEHLVSACSLMSTDARCAEGAVAVARLRGVAMAALALHSALKLKKTESTVRYSALCAWYNRCCCRCCCGLLLWLVYFSTVGYS